MRSSRLNQLMVESAQRRHHLHRSFLETRRSAMQGMQTLIQGQMRSLLGAARRPGVETGHAVGRPPVYTQWQLAEFGSGKLSNCLGPDYIPFDDLKLPRIPSGELQMMSRIVEVHGTRGQFIPGNHLTAEYDVPVDAWFYRDPGQAAAPVSILMEIALQPCGFLSAHLGAFWLFPNERRFFRNLNGSAESLADIDLRGRTVSTRAVLRSHTLHMGTVIERFSFELSCDGVPFYRGESDFGYFPDEAMRNPVGLDGGQTTRTWAEQTGAAGRRIALGPQDLGRFAPPALHLIDEAVVFPGAGLYQQGYVTASRPVDSRDWFYRCHFLNDPVMPGSLGVEAMREALMVYALDQGLWDGSQPFQTALELHRLMVWKYRGQILPDVARQTKLEVHLKSVEASVDGLTLTADASMWADDLRIYEVKNISLKLLKAKGF